MIVIYVHSRLQMVILFIALDIWGLSVFIILGISIFTKGKPLRFYLLNNNKLNQPINRIIRWPFSAAWLRGYVKKIFFYLKGIKI